MSKISELVEILQKGGEGSRGGHVIGHTQTGKPIYSGTHATHQNFTSHEHRDAMNHHYNIWHKTQHQIRTARATNKHWNPPEKVLNFVRHHHHQMRMHSAQATIKEGREERKQNTFVKSETTPFYSAMVAIDQSGKNILLGKRREDGIWTGPGGGAKMGEMPKAAAIREAFEEANIIIDPRQLQELPMGYSDKMRPVHCFLVRLSDEQVKNLSVVNDPDKEVPEWKWFPLAEKLPEPISLNRLQTIINAKMLLAGIVMKSYLPLDMTEGMTQINTHEEAVERRESPHWMDSLTRIMESWEEGQEPATIYIGKDAVLHLVRVDDGVFSGFVKKIDVEGLEETMATIDKMTMASLIQFLKTKELMDETKISPQVKVDQLENLRDVLRNVTVQGDLNITIQKAKALPIGTVRQWGVYKYVKHNDGWVVMGGEHHGKLMGKFGDKPSHADFARHHENTSPKQDEAEPGKGPAKVDAGASKKTDAKTEDSAKPKTPEEERKQAAELGRQAFAAGAKSVPAKDPALMKLLEGRKGGSSIHLLDGWTEGWHEANRNAPVPESKAKPEEKPKEEVKLKEGPKAGEIKKLSEILKPKEESAPVENKGLSPEHTAYREKNPDAIKRVEASGAHKMGLEEFIEHHRNKMAQDLYNMNVAPGPRGEEPTDARKEEVKAQVARHMERKKRSITSTLKERHRLHIQHASSAGMDIHPDAAKEYPGLGGSALPEGMDSELNTKTNLVKGLDFGKTSEKLKKQFVGHLNECNKLLENMGIKFKTPLMFRAINISSLGKKTRGTYSNSQKTIELKDVSEASKTLMHEIGHALDYSMNETDYNRGRHAEQMRQSEDSAKNPELRKLYGELHDLVTGSDYYKHSIEHDKSRKKYLMTPTEVFARAFEVYSLHKAEEMNLSKEFIDTFIPDVLKTKDQELARIQAEKEAIVKEMGTNDNKHEERNKKYSELQAAYTKRAQETDAGWIQLPDEKKKEVKEKVASIMDKILSQEEIRKALQEIDLELLKGFQPLPVGTIRKWHGVDYIKHGDGHWMPVPKGQQQAQAEPQKPQAQPAEQPKPEEKAGPLDHLKPQKGMGGQVKVHSKDLDTALKQGPISIISAGRNPNNEEDRALTEEQVSERYKRLEQDLSDQGYKFTKVRGHYGGVEDSFLVYNPNESEMNNLGKKYNQDSVIHSKGGENVLEFTTGENQGKHHKGQGFQEVPDAKDYYTELTTSDGQKKKFTLNLDFGKHHESESKPVV